MARRVCQVCRLSLPNATDMNPCPVCERETTFVQDGEPDADWKVAVEYALAKKVSPKEKKRRDQRTGRLTRLGFAGVELDMLAESDADLHAVEDLIDKGCSTSLAVRIVL